MNSRVIAGANLKVLNKTVGESYYSNPINEQGTAVSGRYDSLQKRAQLFFSSDLGVLYNISQDHSIGVSVLDVNQPDVSFEGSGDIKKATYRVGVAMKNKIINLSADLAINEFLKNKTDYTFSLGAERNFELPGEYGTSGIRFGGMFGTRDLRRLSLGLSYSFKWFQIDYSYIFILTGIKNSGDLQNIAMTLRFGEPPKDEKIAQLEAEVARETAEKERLLKEIEILETERNRLRSELDAILQKEAGREKGDVSVSTSVPPTEISAERQPAVSVKEEKPNREIPLSEVKREKRFVARPQIEKRDETSKIEFETAMRFYNQLKMRKISVVDEQMTILRQIIRKYKNLGVDTTKAEKELNLLQR